MQAVPQFAFLPSISPLSLGQQLSGKQTKHLQRVDHRLSGTRRPAKDCRSQFQDPRSQIADRLALRSDRCVSDVVGGASSG